MRYMYKSFERLKLGSRKWTWSCKKKFLDEIRLFEIMFTILVKEVTTKILQNTSNG